MPPRVSRSSLPSAKPSKSGPSGRNPRKARKRALNAFSIAGHENPERAKIRRNRLGEVEGGLHRKRPRNEEDADEEGEEEDVGPKRRKQGKSGDGDGSLDEGSDSEGNTWTMGHVADDDDDSDIDSDEAFGESDEARFEGWAFGGSSSNRRSKKGKKARVMEEMGGEDGDVDLGEEQSLDGEDDDEDDLGEDAIDLATALDQYEESEEERKQKKTKKSKKRVSAFDDSDEEPSEVEDLAADGASDFSSSEDDEDEEDRRAQLKDLISALPVEEEQSTGSRRVDVHESSAPSEFGVFRKVDLASFKSKTADPERKRALKLLQGDKSSKRNDIARKLEAPLPKRQQDKLDRMAAKAKADETLERWTDTVKHQRRAEHLSFPLYEPENSRMGESRLMPTTTAEPANDLESTIQTILQQSGLSNGKDDEEQLQKWEELQTNKLPLREVMKRRAQLRKERELLFREEVRAKRIKKIKSKAYRRVHRKEREKLLQRERDGLKAEGVDISEDEREYNDRRRAEERMGAKHRESKWAKGVKATGRAAWDEDARAGVTDMARRNEELRRRIEGKEVRDENEDASDFSSEDDDEDVDSDEGRDEVLQRQLSRLKENPFVADQSKLGSMAFMQKAEAARRARNDEDVERMRRELAGEESDSEEDDNATRAGRRKFGPGANAAKPAVQISRSEFEEAEQPASDDEVGNTNGVVVDGEAITNDVSNRARKAHASKASLNPNKKIAEKTNGRSQNPFLMNISKEKEAPEEADLPLQAHDTAVSVANQPKTKAKLKAKSKPKKSSDDDEPPEPVISAPDAEGWQTVTYGDQDDDGDDESVEKEGIDLDVVLRNQRFANEGFAGDDVEAEFQAEKAAVIKEDDEKVIKNVLPGWGSWTGEGLSKRAKKKKGKVTFQKKDGIKPSNRKDAKLSKVIINERRVKANTKYLSSQLPFPFETKEQYERSLRLPKGPEWTTKKTFQSATKPRVLVKQGIIRPMHKPLV